MKQLHAIPLGPKWKERLALASRAAPEFYESAETVSNTAHAGAIRTAFKDLGLSALFCVQGVPTIAILRMEQYDRAIVAELHAKLWNQGLASILLVISGDVLRVYSLVRVPYSDAGDEFDMRCLIDTLDGLAQVLEIQNLVYGSESGRLWKEHSEFFRPKERIDQVLLENLSETHRLLVDAGLSSEASQALLIQAMFIAYLEDREIIGGAYFNSVSNGSAESFSDVLANGNTSWLSRLFKSLRSDFNGDIFVAPCSFAKASPPPNLTKDHLGILARFRTGREEMREGGGQLRFWGYNFKYIPIELISAVYDRFLGEQEATRREQGAYYTPIFLADSVVAQLWDTLPLEIKDGGKFLDPACGSGIFLVRSFQRLCEHWRETRNSQTIRWDSLLKILSRLNGWDLNGGAVRVAIFSLYIALLEEVSPPDIRELVKRGRILPQLFGENFRCLDFFLISPNEEKFDAIIGNPPWTSRRGEDRESVKWCSANNYPMPGREDAWAFTWKSLLHLNSCGTVGFLLPAMGFLHNHSRISVDTRNKLINTARVRRIVNFSDLRFQLFDGAIRPTSLLVLSQLNENEWPYRIDYWTPKSDLNLQIKRLITLSTTDKSTITSDEAIADPLIFKRRLWMSNTEAKLFNYVSRHRKLGDFTRTFSSISRNQPVDSKDWIIGQGFQPLSGPSGSFVSEFVKQYPFLPVAAFQSLSQPVLHLTTLPSDQVRRKGFERGFNGPRILVPRGVSISQSRLRASYIQTPLTFQDIIQAIVVPSGNEEKAKLLTAFLCSKFSMWYAFHGTASFGSDRPEIKQSELLRLPFPFPSDLPNPKQSESAANQLVSLVDGQLLKASKGFELKSTDNTIFKKIDSLVYEYLSLSESEIGLIEDTVDLIIPSSQPHQGSFPEIWKPSTQSDRKKYVESLRISLSEWFDDASIQAELISRNSDIAILRLTIRDEGTNNPYRETNDKSIGEVLEKLRKHIHKPLAGNFQVMPDFRVFVGSDLYIVKPMKKRFWLRSTALSDSDDIALDLQDSLGAKKVDA